MSHDTLQKFVVNQCEIEYREHEKCLLLTSVEVYEKNCYGLFHVFGFIKSLMSEPILAVVFAYGDAKTFALAF